MTKEEKRTKHASNLIVVTEDKHMKDCSIASLESFFFLFLKIFFFIYSERGRDTGRGRSRLHEGSPMWDSIWGLQDHTLSRRQTLNC